MKTIVQRLKKKNTLKSQILFGYLMFIGITLLLLMVSLGITWRDFIRKNIYSTLYDTNQQISNSIQYYINDLVKLSEYPFSDEEILKILRKTYDESSQEISILNDIQEINNKLYKNVYSMNDHISSVWFFPENLEGRAAVKSRGSIDSSYHIKSESWYETVYQGNGRPYVIGYHQDNGSGKKENVISVARCIIDPVGGEYLGMILINTLVGDYSSLWYSGDTSGSVVVALEDISGRLAIKGKKGESYTELRSFLKESGEQFELDKMYEVSLENGSYYLVASSLPCMDGKIYQFCSKAMFSAGNSFLLGGLLLGIVCMGIMFIFISYAVSTHITKPMDQLVNNMKAVEQGNLKMQTEETGGELQVLAVTFNQMVQRMNSMFEELQIKEQQKREMEMLALQAQINPHFMYNTLNSLRCMSEMQGADGITKMVDAIIHVLRYTAEDVGEMVPIERELEFIKNYVMILNFRYFERFSFIYDIEEGACQYQTLRFVLQPIVENAVIHGFDMSDLHGVIKIKIYIRKQLLYIEVTDNGKGMEEDICKAILEKENKRSLNQIGVYNVNKRIKLNFGEQYGITINSKVGLLEKMLAAY